MIVPRFRNVSLLSVNLAYLSFLLVLSSLIIQVVTLLQPSIFGDKLILIVMLIVTLRVFGISIFVTLVLTMLKVKPKLLRLSDFFIALSVITLLTMNIIELAQTINIVNSDEQTINSGLSIAYPLIDIEIWLLFPIVMIFGIEYKTLPSFLGFIRPRRGLGLLTFVLISSSTIVGLLSVVFTDIVLFRLIFNTLFFSSVVAFVLTIYAFGGFDNSEIRRIIQGEKKTRYNTTVVHIKVSFLMLLFGIILSILFDISYGLEIVAYRFAFYDLAIHTIAIGFIGITISLYLPLMLPPIIGRTVQFTSLNKIPLVLIVVSLGLRVVGDLILGQGVSASNFGSRFLLLPALNFFELLVRLSGWLVLIAMVAFVISVHRSLK